MILVCMFAVTLFLGSLQEAHSSRSPSAFIFPGNLFYNSFFCNYKFDHILTLFPISYETVLLLHPTITSPESIWDAKNSPIRCVPLPNLIIYFSFNLLDSTQVMFIPFCFFQLEVGELWSSRRLLGDLLWILWLVPSPLAIFRTRMSFLP